MLQLFATTVGVFFFQMPTGDWTSLSFMVLSALLRNQFPGSGRSASLKHEVIGGRAPPGVERAA